MLEHDAWSSKINFLIAFGLEAVALKFCNCLANGDLCVNVTKGDRISSFAFFERKKIKF